MDTIFRLDLFYEAELTLNDVLQHSGVQADVIFCGGSDVLLAPATFQDWSRSVTRVYSFIHFSVK